MSASFPCAVCQVLTPRSYDTKTKEWAWLCEACAKKGGSGIDEEHMGIRADDAIPGRLAAALALVGDAVDVAILRNRQHEKLHPDGDERSIFARLRIDGSRRYHVDHQVAAGDRGVIQ